MACVAHGALGHLVTMCKSPDTFAQEQATAALFNLLVNQVNIKTGFAFRISLITHFFSFYLLTGWKHSIAPFSGR